MLDGPLWEPRCEEASRSQLIRAGNPPPLKEMKCLAEGEPASSLRGTCAERAPVRVDAPKLVSVRPDHQTGVVGRSQVIRDPLRRFRWNGHRSAFTVGRLTPIFSASWCGVAAAASSTIRARAANPAGAVDDRVKRSGATRSSARNSKHLRSVQTYRSSHKLVKRSSSRATKGPVDRPVPFTGATQEASGPHLP